MFEISNNLNVCLSSMNPLALKYELSPVSTEEHLILSAHREQAGRRMARVWVWASCAIPSRIKSAENYCYHHCEGRVGVGSGSPGSGSSQIAIAATTPSNNSWTSHCLIHHVIKWDPRLRVKQSKKCKRLD
jgi:hypothetical protein